jgi:TonB-dependent SusC/RagA subfamily outer membrane receptor
MERNSILLQIFRRSVVLILFLLPVSIYAQSGIVITGKITDSAGEPLPGAAVLISGQKGGGTVADIDGIYSITVPSKDSQLQYVFLGYEEKTLTPGNRTVVNVVLEESVETLESAAVVAIGYGEVRKKDISGSVVSANMGEIAKLPVTSVMDGVAGRISGVQISSNDGTPGQSSNVVIRGGNSISGDNSPLYVVDGFPAENFDIGTLDPSEIESFVVLKDASATAIYGSRGANGVIVVNTKKGVASQKPII